MCVCVCLRVCVCKCVREVMCTYTRLLFTTFLSLFNCTTDVKRVSDWPLYCFTLGDARHTQTLPCVCTRALRTHISRGSRRFHSFGSSNTEQQLAPAAGDPTGVSKVRPAPQVAVGVGTWARGKTVVVRVRARAHTVTHPHTVTLTQGQRHGCLGTMHGQIALKHAQRTGLRAQGWAAHRALARALSLARPRAGHLGPAHAAAAQHCGCENIEAENCEAAAL